jgi:hypothetical protein
MNVGPWIERLALCVAFFVAWACTDRVLGTDAAESNDAGSASDTSSASAVSSDVGAGMPVPFTECINAYRFDEDRPSSECLQSFSSSELDAWLGFACATCICTEPCVDDGDCLPREAPVEPRCITLNTNAGASLCLLVCEGDYDCPNDMFCLPSSQANVSACYFALPKSQCCEGDGC